MNTYSDVSDQNSIGGNSDLASGDIDLLNAQTTRKFCTLRFRIAEQALIIKQGGKIPKN